MVARRSQTRPDAFRTAMPACEQAPGVQGRPRAAQGVGGAAPQRAGAQGGPLPMSGRCSSTSVRSPMKQTPRHTQHRIPCASENRRGSLARRAQRLAAAPTRPPPRQVFRLPTAFAEFCARALIHDGGPAKHQGSAYALGRSTVPNRLRVEGVAGPVRRRECTARPEPRVSSGGGANFVVAGSALPQGGWQTLRLPEEYRSRLCLGSASSSSFGPLPGVEGGPVVVRSGARSRFAIHTLDALWAFSGGRAPDLHEERFVQVARLAWYSLPEGTRSGR